MYQNDVIGGAEAVTRKMCQDLRNPDTDFLNSLGRFGIVERSEWPRDPDYCCAKTLTCNRRDIWHSSEKISKK